jgi:hypothetical protein
LNCFSLLYFILATILSIFIILTVFIVNSCFSIKILICVNGTIIQFHCSLILYYYLRAESTAKRPITDTAQCYNYYSEVQDAIKRLWPLKSVGLGGKTSFVAKDCSTNLNLFSSLFMILACLRIRFQTCGRKQQLSLY